MATEDASAAARTMRARRTVYNADVARANLDKGRPMRELKPCTCGHTPHKQPCPVYFREQQAKRRSNPD